MNRPCPNAVQCDRDPIDPLLNLSSAAVNPAAGLCLGITGFCGNDPFRNLSSECDDSDIFAGLITACGCIRDHFFDELRAPGFGPWTFTITGDVPPGIDILTNSPCDGYVVIQGNYELQGRYLFSIEAEDGFGNVSKVSFRFNVLAILTTMLPVSSVGVPYSFQLEAAGGSGRFAWKIVDGALAPDLHLDASGLISGTPTGAMPASVTFEVIDYECEQPDRNFFQPFVELTGATTTTTSTIIGFPGFNTTLVPPTAYKSAEWSGFISNVGLGNIFNMAYCGKETINGVGDCQSSREAQGYHGCFGFGCPQVTFNGPCLFGQAPVSLIVIANYCANKADFANGPSLVDRDVYFPAIGEGMNYTTVFNDTTAQRSTFGVTANGTIASVGRGVVLSDLYSDAEALANAKITHGTGLVAANFPRTKWVASTTAVQYTLSFHSLMTGQAYVGSVIFFHSDGTLSVKTYPFTATGPDHTVIDSIPTPAAGMWTFVSSPAVTFAP